jgi:tetratricopeptide repeat protein
MTTRQTAAFLVLAVGASAQTPKPVPNPNPLQVPVPPIPPTPPIPPMPAMDMPMLLDLQSMRVDMDAIRDTTRNAMDQARWALAESRFDLLDWQQGQQGLQGLQGQQSALRYASGRDAYTSGLSLLASRKYDEAIAQFDRVVAQKGTSADGALYWKAYAQFKLGKTDDAVATIGALRKDFGQSRYQGDAKVLEADARRRAGQPVNPASMDDDDLKILAINGIKQTDPERAIPLLEGVLSATNALRVKKQAIIVLASIPNPKARQILLNYAKGAAGNPDLQIEAIRYIAASGEKSAIAADLMAIYQSTQDTEVKMAVINALGNAGARGGLYSIVGDGNTPVALRTSAMKGSVMSPTDLMALYEKETNKELKSQIAATLGAMGATDQVMRIIKSEKDPDIVRRAIRTLGNQPAAKTGQFLVDTYGTEQNLQTRQSIISALDSQQNAEGLVAIARKEASLELKKAIVRSLSDMASRSKVAADYLTEIIK